MNFKHGRYRRNREKAGLKLHKDGYKPNEEPIYCLTFGCGKVLKPVEAMYGQYCFTCAAYRNKKERERYKFVDKNKRYYVRKFIWNVLNNRWDELKYIEISMELFVKYIYSDDYTNDNSRSFYRYDLYVDTYNADIIYSYTPNLFD